MSLKMFIPVYGSYSNVRGILDDHESGEITFAQAASQAVIAGASTAAVTQMYTMAFGENVMTARAARTNVKVVTTVARATPGSFVILGPGALAFMNYQIIETQVPEEERQGYWRMFAQALTGGFGANLSGLV